MKLLFSAYSCSPGTGSEPAIGWGIVTSAAAKHDCWVLTRTTNREKIESELATVSLPNINVVYIDTPLWKFIYHNQLWIIRASYYVIWQFYAFLVARKLHKKIGFDLVHHATFSNSWLPSFMGLLGIPFMWNAGSRDRISSKFMPAFSASGRKTEKKRNLWITLCRFFLLVPWITERRASVIFSSSSRSTWGAHATVCERPVGALGDFEFQHVRHRNPQTRFRVLSVGRLLPWKGFSLALKAFGHLVHGGIDAEYCIVGAGPEEEVLRDVARKEGIESHVKFIQSIERKDLLGLYADFSVFLLPSFRDSFGYVIVEAMASGIPVIVLDSGGPAFMVDESCGFKISRKNPDQVIEDIVSALKTLYQNPNLREQLGDRAADIVHSKWTWEALGAVYEEWYQRLCPVGTDND